MNLLRRIRTALYIVLTLSCTAAAVSAQVRITEVNVSARNVELTNFGTASQSLSGWFFCHRFAYPALSGTLAPGESRQFSVSFNQTSSDLGLYNSSSFASTSAMQDFIQWGGGGIGRESVAVSKGIWSAGFFFAVPASGVSYHAKGLSTTGVRTGNWFTALPHAGFPLPAPVLESVELTGGQWTVTVQSFYLPAALKPEVNDDLDNLWQLATPAVTSLGSGRVRLVYSSSGGARQFTRVKAAP